MKTRITPVYPAIDYWMKRRCLTYKSFADKANIGYSTVYEMLSGRHLPTKDTIDKVLMVTGMTYEEAFRTDG